MEVKHTKGFIILNEETLQPLAKAKVDSFHRVTSETLLFETEKQADQYASSRLDCWSIIPIDFMHKFIYHEANTTQFTK